MKYNPKLEMHTAGKNSWDKNLYTLDVGCGFPSPEEPYHKRGNVSIDRKRRYEHLGRKSPRARFFELFVKILLGFIKKKDISSFVNNVLIIKAVKR